ncbi:hypothetical protein [Spirosoma gilvum]
MEINHDLLLSLGFLKLPNRKSGYIYKGVAGRLLPEDGTFIFYDFNPAIRTKDELLFMMMAIDYRQRLEDQAY